MTGDPFANLLGGEPVEAPPKRNRGGRPTREEAARKLAEKIDAQASRRAAAAGRGLDDVGGLQALRRPVTINTLATLLDMDPQTVTKRLVDCPHEKEANRKLYSFKEAISYIVKPRMTPEQFVKTLNKADLPPEINKAFWDGQRSRVKYMLEAQEAWETEEILAVLGSAASVIIDHLRMAEEEMRERAKLTDEQARLFAEYMDELRAQLRDKLVDMPRQRQTGSLIDRQLFGSSRDVPVEGVDLDDDEEAEE